MNTIYLDNAATTKIDKEVLELLYTSAQDNFGNPSSTHQFGRKAKSAIETARKNIANHFNVSASEIIFTSGGTEADNLILHNAVLNIGIQRIITSKLEHHAVLNTCIYLQKTNNITVDYVKNDSFGRIDLKHLTELLVTSNQKTLVSLLFINNEIGTILPVNAVVDICKRHAALFHSDTVQAIGHYPIDLKKTPIDFIVASAHKFHGPKGVGFAYFKKGFGILPMIHGGSQEKGARASTENVQAILAMEKALQITVSNAPTIKEHIQNIKLYFISELQKLSKNIQFNGLSDDLQKSSHRILNVRFPLQNNMLLFSLDLAGIAASGGSACQSGSNKGSHVLAEILLQKEAANTTSVRFSFSKFTTIAEIDQTILVLQKLL